MKLTSLTAISPLDGRYASTSQALRPLFSEYGLIYYRCNVEVQWLIYLAQQIDSSGHPLKQDEIKQLLDLLDTFSLSDAERIKSIEKIIQHDVKAIEYFLQEKLKQLKLDRFISLIHFGCTSEDINNLAYALMFKTARERHLLPTLTKLLNTLKTMAHKTASLALLARTHGQPASPTTVGKELINFFARIERQFEQLQSLTIFGKMNGAVGNFNAHHIAYPELNWPKISEQFINRLGLSCHLHTTQIEPHDWIAEALHILIRLNTIILDLDRDLWGYIALDYFSQTAVSTEVGSSTMPHKINPIHFENSEGNLGLANALAHHLAEKLPISRWQRDLSDSTTLRNWGTVWAHSLLAYEATVTGLKQLTPNTTVIEQALNNHWEVLSEAIQSVMRRYGITDAYEQLKSFSRGNPLDATALRAFIDQLNLPEKAKKKLRNLTPQAYTGLAAELTKKLL